MRTSAVRRGRRRGAVLVDARQRVRRRARDRIADSHGLRWRGRDRRAAARTGPPRGGLSDGPREAEAPVEGGGVVAGVVRGRLGAHQAEAR